ncbi:DUF4430 domain-containing protein [Lacrimispora sp.]|uniref:DUF4430 domain-containing protein n=1 Tax=Lacrimispora sp. TaxID=2719234 RepID=UPI00345F96FF
MKKIKSNYHVIFAVIILFLLMTAMAVCYQRFKPEVNPDEKKITLTVISKGKEKKEYSIDTNAQYLEQVMEQAEGLEYSGEAGNYGLMIDTVNGQTVLKGDYWAFYVNGQFCNYGISQQPVYNGDAFEIIYTTGDWNED